MTSEKVFRSICDGLPEQLVVCDAVGAIAYANDAACGLLRTPLTSLTGRKLKDVLLDLSPRNDCLTNAIEATLGGRTTSVGGSHTLHTPAGPVTVEVSLRLLPDGDGDGGQYLVTFVGSRPPEVSDGLADEIARIRSLRAEIFDGVIVEHHEQGIIEVNETAMEALGMGSAQLSGGKTDRPRHAIFLGEDGRELAPEERPAAVTLRTGQAVRHRVIGILHEGITRPRWLLTSTQPYGCADSGLPEAAIITFTDITAQKQLQDDLRALETRFETLAAQAPIGIYLATIDGECEYVNEAYTEITGLRLEDAAGMGWLRIVHPQDRESLLRGWCELTAGGESGDMHYRVLGPNGTVSWVHGRATPLRGPGGEVRGYIGTLADLTDLRLAQDLVRIGIDRSERYFQMAAVMLAVLDPQGRIVRMNHGGCALLGYSEDELMGRMCTDLCAEREREDVLDLLVELNESDDPRLSFLATLVTCSGQEREILWHGVLVRDDAGALVEVICAGEDVTDRQRAVEAQRLAAIGQLAAGVAHEFNNILAAMSMRAQLAAALPTQEQFAKLIDVVMDATDRGSAISGNLSRFAHPGMPQLQYVDPETPVTAALALAQRDIAAANVRVERCSLAGEYFIHADPGQIEQVLLNLIINACQAMPEGGTLTITTDAYANGHCDWVTISVSDTGTGIPPEHIQRIFEPFFTTKGRLGESDVPGTGLGLSVSHGLVTANAGSIDVRSVVGQGTTFTLRFEAHRSPADLEAGEDECEPDDEMQGAGEFRVLVVEDEVFQRETLCELLRRQGMSATGVSSGLAAGTFLTAERFDLVVTDLLMPDGGGGLVLEAAAALSPPLPVIVLSGRPERSAGEEAVRAGAVEYLEKPVRAAELLAAVDRVRIACASTP